MLPSCTKKLQHLPFPQQPNSEGADEYRNEDNDREAEEAVLERQWHIHAPDAGNGRRKCHDDGDRREQLHDVIQSVIGHSREQFARALDDVLIDLRRFDRLHVLNDGIIEKFFVLRMLFKDAVAFDFIKHGGIGTKGGGEIHKVRLEVMKVNEIGILHVVIDLFLDVATAPVDRFQEILIHHAVMIQDLAAEAFHLPDGKPTHLPENHVLKNDRFLRADGDDAAFRKDDAKRDGGIADGDVNCFPRRDIDEDQRIVIFNVYTG